MAWICARLRSRTGGECRLALVHAQHERVVGWVHVEPDHVPDLVDEGRVRGELEGLDPVGLEAKGPPDPRHHGLAHPRPLGHAAGRPVRGALGLGLQGEGDQARDLVVPDPTRRPGAGRVRQSLQPMRRKAGPPLRHTGAAHPQRLRHARVRGARLGTGQHKAGALRQRLPGAVTTDQSRQRGALLRAQGERNRLGTTGHGCLPQRDGDSLGQNRTNRNIIYNSDH